MKDDRQFMKEIYEKYEKEKQGFLESNKVIGNKKRKQIIGAKIIGLVAIAFMVFSLTLIKEKKIEEPNNQEENKINLATVGNFDHLYTILKQTQNVNEKELTTEESMKDSTNDAKREEKKEIQTNEDYSKTNTQEEKVEEADIVKTDGKYIYYVVDKTIRIISTELKKVAQIEYQDKNFMPKEIYIEGNHLIVLGSHYSNGAIMEKQIIEDTTRIREYNKMTCFIYDIRQKEKPQEIRKIEIKGNYVESRMIEQNLYLVVQQNISTNLLRDSSKEELEQEDFKPSYRDTRSGEEEKKIGFDQIYCFEQMQNINYLILAGINLEKQEEIEIKAFLGASEKIYCSEKNLYITQTDYPVNPLTRELKEVTTQLLKFSLEEGKIHYQAETKIEGYLNNQFSMGEQDGYLRIATTIGTLWGMEEKTSNQLMILDENLKQVGKIENIAKGEKIYSARYTKDRAYLVTYREVDPLFVIDLTNPKEPKILGELKISGYSTYLHPYDENHLIGFGYETKADGSRITTSGLKMVMFEVSDLANPKVLFQTHIGTNRTSSELLYNHKAFLFRKDQNVIAFPIIDYHNRSRQHKALIYKIDLEKGFLLEAEIQNTGNDENRMERILYSQENYYIVSQREIKKLNQQFKEIQKIEL